MRSGVSGSFVIFERPPPLPIDVMQRAGEMFVASMTGHIAAGQQADGSPQTRNKPSTTARKLRRTRDLTPLVDLDRSLVSPESYTISASENQVAIELNDQAGAAEKAGWLTTPDPRGHRNLYRGFFSLAPGARREVLEQIIRPALKRQARAAMKRLGMGRGSGMRMK